MHTFSENSSGVPAFLAKLWRLVEDEETNSLIYWSADGKSFIIQNQAQFAREILPLNYKHNNMASFIRQLNMYGFHKITSLDGGGLKFDRDEMEFSHPYFQRDHPYLLEHIKRKISTAKTTNVDDKSNIKHEIVSKVLSEVKSMKGRQDSLDNRFVSMKQENEALWREVAILRQKHMKQQQIVNKLIQFLVTIVQPQRGSGIGSMSGMSGVKRRYQLMINDIPDANKLRKTSRSSSDGPVIRELTEELLDNFDDDIPASPYVVSPRNFTGQTPTYEIENIDEVDPDQIISDDTEIVQTVAGSTNTDENASGNVYNTADYSTDLIYDINTAKVPTVGLITNNAGTSCTANNDVDNIPVEELLENVTTTVPNRMTTFIKTEKKPTQSILVQQQPTVKSGLNPKLIANKKQIPGNVVIANTNLNVQGVKRLPIVKIAPNQSSNNQTMAGDRRSGATGKSLIDAQKLKAVKQQQQLQLQLQQQQLQQQQIGQQKQVVQTISQPGNKPILITVGTVPKPISSSDQQSASTVTMGKTYKNKNDFISSEIPNELFQDDSSEANFDGNNLVTEANNTDQIMNDLTGDFGQSVPAGASTSGANPFNKNLMVAKYNKGMTNDDIMRISSTPETHCYREQLNQHLDGVQGDLDALKDLLRNGDDYQMDANALLSNQNDATQKYNSVLSGIGAESIMSVINKLFGDSNPDIFQQYGIPMNPTDTTQMPGMDDRQRTQDDGSSQTQAATGSELISYQQAQTPIDFTDFLNLEDNDLAMNASDATAAAAAAGMSPALSVPMPINSVQHMPFVNQFNGDLATPYIKQEQFAYPKMNS